MNRKHRQEMKYTYTPLRPSNRSISFTLLGNLAIPAQLGSTSRSCPTEERHSRLENSAGRGFQCTSVRCR